MITNEKPSSRLVQTNFLKIKRERLCVKKLVLRIHTQRVLLEGLYHKASMGFKWQTLTKVLHNKPPSLLIPTKLLRFIYAPKSIELNFKIYDDRIIYSSLRF